MDRVLGGIEKIIADQNGQGDVPSLPLNQNQRQPQPQIGAVGQQGSTR